MTEVSTVQTEVTPLDVEVTASNSVEIATVEDGLDVTISKKEYKIVGDEVYIAKLYDDAPQWMKDLVQLVVDNTMASESTVLLNNLVSQLNQFAVSYVPLNTYTQSILDLSNADTAMHNTIETLNSNFNDGLNEANSQIIDLQSTKASKTEVAAKVIETITAQLALPTSDIGATIANLQQAIVNGDGANADSITTLTSALEGEVDARASAIETINTYVGLVDGIPNGTGLLASIDNLQNQIDGNIATWFYNGEPTLLNAPANMWVTATDKSNHVGDIYYDKTSGYGYRFAYEDIVDVPDAGIVYSWIRIVDTDVVKALADAANAQETADGKITTFYQTTAPVAEGIGDIWIDSDNGNKMYRWNGSSWGTDLVGVMVANASAVTELSTELSNGTNTWAAADSQVTNSLTTKIANDVASVESKWEYNSVVGINGVYKRSGFGLTTNYSGGSGTKADPYTSEFWIDATKLKFTNSAATGRTAPFTIDASGATPQITFNGKVSFSNVTDVPQLGSTPQEVVNAVNAGNTTTIDGGKITTGSIAADKINTNSLVAENIRSTSVIQGNTIIGANIQGARINGAVIKASYLDLDGELEVLTDYHISPAMYSANPAIYTDAVYIEADNEYRIPTLSSVSSGIVNTSVAIPNSSSYPAILSGQTLTRNKVYSSLLYPYNVANVNSNIKSRRIRPYFTSTATTLFTASLVSGVSSEVMLAAYVNVYVYFGDTLLLHVYGGSSGTAIYQTGYGAYYANGVMFYGGSFSDPLITYTVTVLGFTFTITSSPGAYSSRSLAISMSKISEFTQLPFDFINSSIRVVTGNDMFISTYSVTAPKIYINNML